MTASPNGPRTVLAAPLYNNAGYLPAALDSLLAQSEPDFSLILVDDGSEDATPAIAQRYAQRDPRVSYWRNEARLGVVGNWRRCLRLAREHYPQAEYFGWASDHDLWDPHWLQALVAEMDRHPEMVLAYPRIERMTAEGELDRVRGGFETVGVTAVDERIRRTCRSMHAGDMCYGLMRVDPVDHAGCFRPLLEPDRLMIVELAVQGQFGYVQDVTWKRRFVKSATRARQRRQLFPGRPPLHSWVPPWIVRPLVFLWLYAIRGHGAPQVSRLRGLRLALTYAVASSRQVIAQRREVARRVLYKPLRKKIRHARRRAKRRTRAVVGAVAVRLSRRQP